MSAYHFLLFVLSIMCLSVLIGVAYLTVKGSRTGNKPNIRVFDPVEEKPVVDDALPEGKAEDAPVWSDLLRFPPGPGHTALRFAESPKNVAPEHRGADSKSCPGSNSQDSWGDRAREDFNRTMHGG